jgi:hypothetical protein
MRICHIEEMKVNGIETVLAAKMAEECRFYWAAQQKCFSGWVV